MKNDDRIQLITLMQVMAMACILISHGFTDGMILNNSIYVVVFILQRCSLTAFMAASGFLFLYGDQVKRHGALGFIAHRAKRLLLPYFVLQILFFLPKMGIRMLLGGGLGIEELAMLVLSPRNAVLPHLWFLWALFLLNIAAVVLYPILKHPVGCLAATVCFWRVASMGIEMPVVGIEDALAQGCWFFLGCFLASLRMDKVLCRFPAAVLAAGVAYHIWLLKKDTFTQLFFGNTYLWVLLDMLVFTMTAAAWLSRTKLGSLMSKAGKYTFTIYMLALPVQNLVAFLPVGDGVQMAVSILLGAAAPVGIALAAGWAKDRWDLPWLPALIGMSK